MIEGTGGTPAFGFGHADEHPYRRLTADWVKVPLASALLLVSAFHTGNEYAAERRIDRLFADWPERFGDVYRGLFAVGTLWGVGLVVVAALLRTVAGDSASCSVSVASPLGSWRSGVGFVVAGRSVGDAFVRVFDGSGPGRTPRCTSP